MGVTEGRRIAKHCQLTVLALGALLVFGAIACQSPELEAGSELLREARPAPAGEVAVEAPPAIVVSSQFPSDLNPGGGGAPMATFEQAAAFAWQEFIALNWPAQPGRRDTPDPSKKFGEAASTWGTNVPSAVVWETFAHRVEIFPGTGAPPAGSSYTTAPPQYVYQNPVPQNPKSNSSSTPWVNLDETTQIGQNIMYAGINSSSQQFPEDAILFLAKGNGPEYDYVYTQKFWDSSVKSGPQSATVQYLLNDPNQVPDPNSQKVQSGKLIALPYGSVEMKAGWRRLGPNDNPEHFHTAQVRYYEESGGSTTYYDSTASETWGLLGLHIIHKTPSAPYFIYATFEQQDNLLDPNGMPVEDADGKVIRSNLPDLDAGSGQAISSQNATTTTAQVLSPSTSSARPAKRLYYVNTVDIAGTTTPTGLPQGPVAVNQRKHSIPQAIINANQAAHQAIAAYNAQNPSETANSPWLHYKLVNIQWVPIDKEPGVDYDAAYTPKPTTPGGVTLDPSTYYQNNIVIETNYNLQEFSGQFSNFYLITDYANVPYGVDGAGVNPNPPFAGSSPFRNVWYQPPSHSNAVGHNMGGCMGCHGNAQVAGADFSFLLQNGAITAPEGLTDPAEITKENLKMGSI